MHSLTPFVVYTFVVYTFVVYIFRRARSRVSINWSVSWLPKVMPSQSPPSSAAPLVPSWARRVLSYSVPALLGSPSQAARVSHETDSWPSLCRSSFGSVDWPCRSRSECASALPQLPDASRQRLLRQTPAPDPLTRDSFTRPDAQPPSSCSSWCR